MQPKLTYRLVWDVKIQKFLLARFARRNIINKFKLYLLPAHHVRIYFQTASSLYDHCLMYYILLYILYILISIRMTNNHDLTALNNIWVMFTQAYRINPSVKLAREPNRALSWLWSCLVFPLAACCCRENLNWV